MSNDIVLDRLISMRNQPSGQDNPYERNPALPASQVWKWLNGEFEPETVRAAVQQCLRESADISWKDDVPSQRQLFLTDCCLVLAREVPEMLLTAALVQELAYKLNSVVASNHLGPLVTRYLDSAQLLDALTLGLRMAEFALPRASCLGGLALYQPRIQRPTELHLLERSLSAFESELRKLRLREDECLGAVRGARGAVWAIRRKRPDLVKPSANEFVALRIEDGQATHHVIERREDAEASILISKLELSGRRLTIDYECVDPAVLPEDVPNLIEDVLLRRYAYNSYSSAADEVVFTDARYKQSRCRPALGREATR